MFWPSWLIWWSGLVEGLGQPASHDFPDFAARQRVDAMEGHGNLVRNQMLAAEGVEIPMGRLPDEKHDRHRTEPRVRYAYDRPRADPWCQHHHAPPPPGHHPPPPPLPAFAA